MLSVVPVVLLALLPVCAAGSEYRDLTGPAENFNFSFSGEEMKLSLYAYDTIGLKYSIERVDELGTITSLQIANDNWNVTIWINGMLYHQFGQCETIIFNLDASDDDKPISFRDKITNDIDFEADVNDEKYKLQYYNIVEEEEQAPAEEQK